MKNLIHLRLEFTSLDLINELLLLKLGRFRTTRILRHVIKSETRLQNRRIQRLLGKNMWYVRSFIPLLTPCPGESTQIIRERGWGKPFQGISMPPLQHQIRITSPETSSNLMYDVQNFFAIEYVKPVQFVRRCEGNVNWATSHLEPFIGMTTTSSMSQPTVHLIEKEPVLSKLKTLLEMNSWTDVQAIINGEMVYSNVDCIFQSILSMYTTIPLSELAPFAGTTKGGTTNHHVKSRNFRDSIVRNVLSNLYQQFSGNSFTHSRIAASAYHYLINFMYVMCYAISVCCLECNVSTNLTLPHTIWAVTEPCVWCDTPIFEQPIICDPACLPTRIDKKLVSTQIAQRAVDILQNALSEFKEQNFITIPPQGQLSPQAAAIGIFQEVVDLAVKRRRQLETMYTQHALSAEGYKTLAALQTKAIQCNVDISDIRNLPSNLICEPLAQIVYDQLLKTFLDINLDNVGYYLSIYPTSELPWYPLIDLFHDAGKLSDIIQIMQTWGGCPPGTSYVNVVEACNFVAQSSFARIASGIQRPISVYLSYYTPDTYIYHITRSLVVGLKVMINIHLLPAIQGWNTLLKQSRIQTEEDRNLMMITMSILYLICSCNVTDPEYVQELVNALEEIVSLNVLTIPTDTLDTDIIEAGNNEDTLKRNGYYVIVKSTPFLLWNQIKEHILTDDNFFQYMEQVVTYSERFSVIIVSTTITHCINVVRSYSEESHVNEEQIQQEINHRARHPRTYQDPGLPQIRLGRLKSNSLHITRIEGIPHNQIRPLDPKDFRNEKVILRPQELYRPFGQVKTSMNKFCEIFTLLGLLDAVSSGLIIVISGDGLGGTSSFSCVYAPGSTIY